MSNQIFRAFRGGLVVWVASLLLGADAAPPAQAADKSLAELIRELQPPNTPSERLRAAEAVAEYGPIAVPALLPLLDRDNETTPMYVCVALVRLGPEAQAAVPALIAKIARREWRYRADALRTLQQIGPGAVAAVPTLIGLLTAEDARIRLLA